MTFLSDVAKKPVAVHVPTDNDGLNVKRIESDLAAIENEPCAWLKISPRNPPSLRELLVKITPPPPSIWAGIEFHFVLRFGDEYPNKPPDCRFVGGPGPRPPRMFHPNIEGEDGKTEWLVDLNILHKDWMLSPAMGVKEIVLGLAMLFLEPNMEDSLPGTAKQAAQMMLDNPKEFEAKTLRWARGDYRP